MKHLMRRSIAYLLLVALLLSAIPVAFAEKAAQPETAESDRPATKAVAVVQNRTLAYSKKPMVGYWIDSSSFTISNTNIDNLVSRGVTDFYVQVKTDDGSFDTTALSNVISHAGSTARVHAVLKIALDDTYLANNEKAAQYHFRVGYKNSANGGDTRTGYVDLGNTSYQSYINNQINTIEAISGIDGIMLDDARYGADYYGWGDDLRTAMGKSDYNTFAAALCKQYGYNYSTDIDGYYIFKDANGTADDVSFKNLINSNSAAAQKYTNHRVNRTMSFVKSVRDNLKSGLILSMNIMPEAADSIYGKSLYGQNCSVVAPYVDYVILKSYFADFYGYTGNEYDTQFPSRLAKLVAKEGCNVVAGLQASRISNTDTSGRNGYFVSGYDARAQMEYLNDARRAVNGDATYGGDILGSCVYLGGLSAQVKVSYNHSAKTVSFSFVNGASTVKSIRIQLYNGYYIDKSKCTVSGTSYTYNSVTYTVGGTASNGYYPRCDLSVTINPYATKTYTLPVCTNAGAQKAIDYNYNHFAAFAIYNSTSKNNTTFLPVYQASFVNSAHTSCSFTKTTPQPATCLAAGYNLYTCSTCGYDYAEYVAKLSHNYTTSVVAPTCTAEGYTKNTCTNGCGDTYNTNTVAALGHSYTSTVVAPTCETAGYTKYVCSRCSNTYNDNDKPALGHNYVGVETTPATCEAPGLMTYTCSNCTASYTQEIAKLEHDYYEDVTPPSCLVDGFTTFTCVECGYSYDGNYVTAVGHDYNAVETPPTCTEDGYTTFTCVECGVYYISDEVSATGHEFEIEVIDPTCTEGGYTYYICSCGLDYTTDETDPLGHDFVYIENGDTHIVNCNNCDYNEIEEHDLIDSVCDLCGAVVCDHPNAELVIETPATCTADGVEILYCADCNSTLSTRPIPAIGHSLTKTEAKAPTCTEDGNREYYRCSGCGLYYADANNQFVLPESYITLTAIGHDYKSVVTDPTCENAGFTTNTCANCGDIYTSDEKEALGHDYGYTNNGDDHSIVCANCNDTTTESHNYIDGVCVCGAEFRDYSGTYYIFAKRSSGNFQYMSNDLGAVSTKRYTAIDSGAEELPAKIAEGQLSYVFIISMNEDGTYTICDGNGKYLNWATGNSGILTDEARNVNIVPSETAGRVNINFVVSETESRYLSLNNINGNNYFAWYKGTQINDLALVPVDEIAHDHIYVGSVTVDPTCVEMGTTTYTCSICGDSYTAKDVPTADHTYGYVDNGADHTATCTVCSYSENQPHAHVNNLCVCGNKIEDYTGTYYIFTSRGTDNFMKMSNDLGKTSTKRYTAVDTGSVVLPETITDPVEDFVFTIAKSEGGYYTICDGNGMYLTWTSGNSGNLSDTPKNFIIKASDVEGKVNIYFWVNDTESRYLSLNNTSGNNYFAWYKGTQIQNLILVPVNGEIHYHDFVETSREEASCTEDGKIYSACQCGKTMEEVVKATGHHEVLVDNGEGGHYGQCCVCLVTTSDTVEHTFVDGTCECGATETTEPATEYVDTLKPTMSIVVGAEMSVAFTVNQSMVSKYESFYLVVEKDMVGAESKTVTFGYGEGQTALTPMPNATNPFL
ncbi:MAG: hypothetical protein E7467_08230, partial [Ruminococcaceae bacterium]|nr:hypothetical protein [Oscillospiraceae bacterium]